MKLLDMNDMKVIFASDRSLTIRDFGMYEGRIMTIASTDGDPAIELTFVMPWVFDLPFHFEGITVFASTIAEAQGRIPTIDPILLNPYQKIFLVESSTLIYFVICSNAHVINEG